MKKIFSFLSVVLLMVLLVGCQADNASVPKMKGNKLSEEEKVAFLSNIDLSQSVASEQIYKAISFEMFAKGYYKTETKIVVDANYNQNVNFDLNLKAQLSNTEKLNEAKGLLETSAKIDADLYGIKTKGNVSANAYLLNDYFYVNGNVKLKSNDDILEINSKIPNTKISDYKLSDLTGVFDDDLMVDELPYFDVPDFNFSDIDLSIFSMSDIQVNVKNNVYQVLLTLNKETIQKYLKDNEEFLDLIDSDLDVVSILENLKSFSLKFYFEFDNSLKIISKVVFNVDLESKYNNNSIFSGISSTEIKLEMKMSVEFNNKDIKLPNLNNYQEVKLEDLLKGFPGLA